MADGPLGQFVRRYLHRVVNERDISAVDDMVSPGYRGSGQGWPADIAGLREFYRSQAHLRPDWHIDVQETLEVGEWVAVRASAGGTVAHNKAGDPLPSAFHTTVEWLTVYRIVEGRIAEVEFLSVVDAISR